MRLSTILRYKKFFKKRDFVIQDPDKIVPMNLKGFGLNFFTVFATTGIVFLFIIPSPDVCFDKLFYQSAHFRDFVDSGGFEGVPLNYSKRRLRIYKETEAYQKRTLYQENSIAYKA